MTHVVTVRVPENQQWGGDCAEKQSAHNDVGTVHLSRKWRSDVIVVWSRTSSHVSCLSSSRLSPPAHKPHHLSVHMSECWIRLRLKVLTPVLWRRCYFVCVCVRQGRTQGVALSRCSLVTIWHLERERLLVAAGHACTDTHTHTQSTSSVWDHIWMWLAFPQTLLLHVENQEKLLNAELSLDVYLFIVLELWNQTLFMSLTLSFTSRSKNDQ